MTSQYNHKNEYTFSDFDKHLCLKPSIEMWLVILFLLRPYLIIASTIKTGPDAQTFKALSFMRQLVYPDFLSMLLGIIATIPAVLFIIAWTRRKPHAPAFFRTTWHKSALLLTISAFLSIATVFLPLAYGAIHKISWIGWVQVGISLIIIQYLLSSKRVKDTFMDYPD